MALAASRITPSTRSGLDSMGTWLLAPSTVVAPIRFATKRSRSGWTVRSFLATMYQLGFDLQATPSPCCVNRSGTGTAWVAPDDLLLRLGKVPGESGHAIPT